MQLYPLCVLCAANSAQLKKKKSLLLLFDQSKNNIKETMLNTQVYSASSNMIHWRPSPALAFQYIHRPCLGFAYADKVR